ncbi:unnamed protein product [Peronospora belbahrii]|uniref:ABC transporter family G domain-containing protein n=1 Tax=Peronospora belbahrii TaxID=622444 RepID=A0AAU9KQU0_9STRA|nr:unnamed protein product [Peronospora belbahrii]
MLVQDFGDQNVLIVDEVSHNCDSNHRLRKEVTVSMLRRSKTDACEGFDVLLVLQNGDVVYHGTSKEIVKYLHDLGYQYAPEQQVAQFLLSLTAEEKDRFCVTVPTDFKLRDSSNHFIKNFAILMRYADDTAVIAGGNVTPASIDIAAYHNRCPTATDHNSVTFLNIAAAVSVTKQTSTASGESVKSEVLRSEESDGTIVTKTVRTTSHTVKSDNGALVTTIEEESSSTSTSASIASASSDTAVSTTEQASAAPDKSVKTEVFSSEESNGTIVTKTVRTTGQTIKSDTGALVTTIEVETTTEVRFSAGTSNTIVTTGTFNEVEDMKTFTATISKPASSFLTRRRRRRCARSGSQT